MKRWQPTGWQSTEDKKCQKMLSRMERKGEKDLQTISDNDTISRNILRKVQGGPI